MSAALPENDAPVYGPDASPEQVEALRARVQVIGPSLILYRELPVLSVFQIETMMARLAELLAERHPAALIVDLNDRPVQRPPDAECRRAIAKHLRKLAGQIRSCGVVTDNPVHAVSVRFVSALLPFEVKRYRTLEAAREALDGG